MAAVWIILAKTRFPAELILRQTSDYGHGIFAETNLSANQIRDSIARLLAAFGFPKRAFVVYLREDRDAG